MTSTYLTCALLRLGACDEARDWVSGKDLATAWSTCTRPDWMLWLLDALGYDDERTLRLFGCWCARQVWHLLTDARSRTAVEVAERYAVGEATYEELSSARDAAWDAAAVAGGAAWDAAWAATRAAARAAAWAASWAASWAAQADRLREMVPLAEVERLMEEAATNDSD